ncbi:MAG: glycosyltransferase [Desulfobacteraceae bacterium]|nr:glycosyltransferase [Desulfobacteraceae bacterium]
MLTINDGNSGPADLSIIVPAYNEAGYLQKTLSALTMAAGRTPLRGEILVVDNRSTDATAQIAENGGARVVYEPVRQISRARNAGARAAEGRYLVFVDADTIVPAALFSEAVGRLEDGSAGGGGSVVAADVRLPPLGRLALAGWNRFSMVFRLAAGSFIFCRREGFHAVGGFSEAVYASEEIGFSLRYRRWARSRGMDFTILSSAPVVTSARKLDWFSTPRIALSTLLLLAYPPAVRSRRLCWLWYHRPDPRRRR